MSEIPLNSDKLDIVNTEEVKPDNVNPDEIKPELDVELKIKIGDNKNLELGVDINEEAIMDAAKEFITNVVSDEKDEKKDEKSPATKKKYARCFCGIRKRT